jgi:hypothetical protein
MGSFHFVDAGGTAWLVLPGLPATYPDLGERPDSGPAFVGVTFRSSEGEVRVLPRAAMPRHAGAEITPPPVGTTSRVPRQAPTHWEEMLRYALKWPPA